MGQKYLVAGKRVSMRLWVQEPGRKLKAPTTRDYETVGYVISGSARLDLEGQILNLKAGDLWLVPAGATALSDKPERACEGCWSGAFRPPADATRPGRQNGSV